MSKRIDMVVEGGRVVAGGVVAEATVAISGERIAALLEPGPLPPEAAGAERLDASGKIVMPGIIDAHVHFRNFNQQTDSFGDLSVAAAFGGVTTVIPYVQGKVGMPAREFLTHFREEGEAQSLVDFAMHCRLQGPEPGMAKQFDDAFDLGVTSFKMFMAFRQKGMMWDDYSLCQAMEHLGRRGGTYCCHAENGDITDFLEERFHAEGRYTPENFLAARPPEAEVEATFRVLTIAKVVRCPLYLVHMSTARGVALGHQARLAGQPVWVETCPQYLTLTADEMERRGPLAKISPPLRTRDEVDALWGAVAGGAVDVVASDHAPWPLESKQLPAERFVESPFGMPGVETLLPVTYGEGVAGGRIDLPKLAELLCEAPARIFGLAPRKGAIAVGADADLMLIDPDAELTLRADEMHSRAGFTGFEGRTVRGKPVATIVRGKVVMRDGRLLQPPGYGRYLPRDPQGAVGWAYRGVSREAEPGVRFVPAGG